MENTNRKGWLLRNSGVVVTTAFNLINKLKPRRKPNENSMRRVPASLPVPAAMPPRPLGEQQCNGVHPPNGGLPASQPPAKRSASDFYFGKVLGEGSYATVYLVRDVHTHREYAIKVCEKQHIIRERKKEHVKREKDILNLLTNNNVPFFVKLYCTFQDSVRLYFVLSYAKNGELLPHINSGSLNVECIRFYAAEILLALEHLRRLNIVHRDLKPENILLDDNNHVLITDFGSAKVGNSISDSDSDEEQKFRERRNSFVGTAQYVSPELLTDKDKVSATSDLWAFGCVIYQMIEGSPPFNSKSDYLIFQKITKLEYEFSQKFWPSAQDLIEKLLVLDPTQRLGANDQDGYPSIREHPFFKGIDFDSLHRTTPPFHAPATSFDESVWDDLEPGLDVRQMARLLGIEINIPVNIAKPARSNSSSSKNKFSIKINSISDLSPSDISQFLLKQLTENPEWHRITNSNLILRQGLVDKKKGLFARRRMLLLTLGPHLYYADPVNMVLKGEIPWSSELEVEVKNFKTFQIHTPGRTYHLEDPEGFAIDWKDAIYDLKHSVYGNTTT